MVWFCLYIELLVLLFVCTNDGSFSFGIQGLDVPDTCQRKSLRVSDKQSMRPMATRSETIGEWKRGEEGDVLENIPSAYS